MILCLICCFIPLLVLLCLCNTCIKVPVKNQLFAVLFGLIIILPISIIQYVIPRFHLLIEHPALASLLQSLLVYGLIEEAFKSLALYCLPVKAEKPFEFLITAFVLALSLACFESVIYFLDHLQKAHEIGASLLLSKIFIRIVTADIIHLSCTGILSMFVYNLKNQKNFKHLSNFIMAVLLHGSYDFFVGFNNRFYYFAIVVILFAVVQCRMSYTAYLDNNKANIG